jgi:MinD-like ATPase involved in chromosome partitioning or flagellar assembly
VARHDREESLEEQLAWLDAIKETEEVPVPVSASAASADEPIASPYPQDPWSLVPTQHDTPTPPLFRAAVDSVYGAAAADDLPEGESEAAEWLGTAATKQEPAAPAPSRDELEDPFLAPLKPLPRLDDTDTYALTFTAPETRQPETKQPETKQQAAKQPESEQPDASRPDARQPETRQPDEPGAAEKGDKPGEVKETAESSWPAAAVEKAAVRQEAPAEERAEEEARDPWSDTLPRSERPQWAVPEAQQAEPEKPSWAAEQDKKPSWGTDPEKTPEKTWGAEPDKRPSWGDSEQRDEPEDRSRRDELPHWGEPESHPNWSEPESHPNWSESETRPNWDVPGERLHWAERDEHPLERPHERVQEQQAPEQSQEQAQEQTQQRPQERLQWSDPEDRPQWTDPLRQDRPQWPERQEWRPAEREIPPPHVPEPQQQLERPPHHEEQPRPRRRPAPVPVFTAPPRPPVTGRPTAESLDPESLLRGRRNAPSKGWRRMIYKASGGWIKPGEPPEVRRRRELVARARTPVTAGHHRVAVLSLKGGVGKTTTTVGLGATLAQMRGDRVIAVDANPDRGTLSDKLVLETSATVRDLLNEREQVKRYVDIRAFTSQAGSRLEVLASDRDPSVSEAFSGADYQAVSQVLENFYSICLTDCGTGLLHSAMGGVLGLADQIVLVSSPSVDGARAASATLDWLEAHHYGDLVKAATVVLCSVRPRSKSAVDIKKLEAHFAARCRAVIRVPYDPHLEEGAEIDLDRLQESTREAYLQLAASVGDGFAGIRE